MHPKARATPLLSRRGHVVRPGPSWDMASLAAAPPNPATLQLGGPAFPVCGCGHSVLSPSPQDVGIRVPSSNKLTTPAEDVTALVTCGDGAARQREASSWPPAWSVGRGGDVGMPPGEAQPLPVSRSPPVRLHRGAANSHASGCPWGAMCLGCISRLGFPGGRPAGRCTCSLHRAGGRPYARHHLLAAPASLSSPGRLQGQQGSCVPSPLCRLGGHSPGIGGPGPGGPEEASGLIRPQASRGRAAEWSGAAHLPGGASCGRMSEPSAGSSLYLHQQKLSHLEIQGTDGQDCGDQGRYLRDLLLVGP